MGRMLVLALLCCLALPPAVLAAQVVVVGGDSAHHRAVFVAMRQALERGRVGHELIYRTLEQYRADADPAPSLLVAVGTAAARALAHAPRQAPLLCVLLPRGDYTALSLDQVTGVSALFIDQPVSRYLLLVRIALPQRRDVGAVLGPLSAALETELLDEGRRLRLAVQTATITDSRELATALGQVSSPSGVMLALPDPLVVNANTASTLILSAYQRGVALVGYSQALAKAGALMTVHSTPEQIGQETGEIALAALAATPPPLPPPRYPSYFSVSVNYQVARALDLNLPTEQQLVRELRRQEGAR